jgi:hypothetical protein
MMPFGSAQFLDVFARYNEAVWPAPLVLTAAAIASLVLVVARPAIGERVMGALLAVLWSWSAVAYHFASFARINPAAWAFGALFLFGASVFLWQGVVKGNLQLRALHGTRAWAGWATIAYALVGYPLLAHALGHRYPALPTFGVPCPTTIFTFGVLMLASVPLPRIVLAAPLAWAAMASTAIFALGMLEDLGLLVAALASLLGLLRRGSARATS